MATCCFFSCCGSLLVGASFVIAGIKKVLDPAPAVAAIKASPSGIYAAAVGRCGCIEKNAALLPNVVMAVSGSVALAGLMFTANVGRSFACGLLSAVVIGYTAIAHVNFSDVAATPEAARVHIGKNLALVGALWMIGAASARKKCDASAAASKKCPYAAKSAQ